MSVDQILDVLRSQSGDTITISAKRLEALCKEIKSLRSEVETLPLIRIRIMNRRPQMQISPVYSYQDDRPEIQFGRVNFELEKVDEALKAYTANPNEQTSDALCMAIYQTEIMLETMALQVEPDYSKRHVNFLRLFKKIVRKLFIAAVLKVSKTKRKSTAFYTVLFQKRFESGLERKSDVRRSHEFHIAELTNKF